MPPWRPSGSFRPLQAVTRAAALVPRVRDRGARRQGWRAWAVLGDRSARCRFGPAAAGARVGVGAAAGTQGHDRHGRRPPGAQARQRPSGCAATWRGRSKPRSRSSRLPPGPALPARPSGRRRHEDLSTGGGAGGGDCPTGPRGPHLDWRPAGLVQGQDEPSGFEAGLADRPPARWTQPCRPVMAWRRKRRSVTHSQAASGSRQRGAARLALLRLCCQNARVSRTEKAQARGLPQSRTLRLVSTTGSPYQVRSSARSPFSRPDSPGSRLAPCAERAERIHRRQHSVGARAVGEGDRRDPILAPKPPGCQHGPAVRRQQQGAGKLQIAGPIRDVPDISW